MPRLKANESLCSAAKALEVIGDRWSLLLIREVFFGTRRFDDFASHLGIARNMLSTRLSKLVEEGILVQAPLQADALRQGYFLTDKGRDLLPVLIALLQWGDRWLQTPQSVPMQVVEGASGELLGPMRPRGADGRELALADLDWIPGPGADDPRIAPLVQAYERQRRPRIKSNQAT